MKKQVIVIPGGDTYDTHKQYVASLRRAKLNFNNLRIKRWKETLGDKLGKDFEVIAPGMPNSLDARYLEWKIWFEKLIPYLNKEVVLVGHSLGGIFLTKYLSEKRFPYKIRGIFLVAPPFKSRKNGESLTDFKLSKSPKGAAKYSDKIHLYFSKDDPLVPFSNLKEYAKAFPGATKHVFKDRGHFAGQNFPEIVKGIKGLYKK